MSEQTMSIELNFFRRGRTIEQLDTVFDIACHMYPECADRWRATQTAVKDTMAVYTKMKKGQKEASHDN